MKGSNHFLKLLSPLLIFGIALFAVIMAMEGYQSYQREQDAIEDYTSSSMKSLILDLEIKAVSTVAVMKTEAYSGDFRQVDTSEMYSFLERFVNANDFILDACVDFWDPDQDENMVAYSNTYYAARDSSSGNLVHGVKKVYNWAVNYDELSCYTRAAETGEACWSQPYCDSLFTNRYLVTCYFKAPSPGVMLSVDVEMEKLLSSINGQQFYDNSRMYIAARDGTTFTLNGLSDGDSDFDLVLLPDSQIDDKDCIRISAHYNNLDLDIINVVPKDEIRSFSWAQFFILLVVCMLALTAVASLVHLAFRKAQEDLAESVRKADEEQMTLQRIESDLSRAAMLQRRMLTSPDKGVHFACEGSGSVDMMAHVFPAREVGGDLYEYRRIGNSLVMCVADVSGKGMAASVLMTMCCTLFHAYGFEADAQAPAAFLKYMNAQLCRRNEEMMFVTMWVGVLDLTSGALRYSSAGHNPPVLSGDGQASFLELCQGPPLGLVRDAEFKTAETIIPRGKSLLLYTDGITEAEDPTNSLFGDDRLLDVCRETASGSPQVVCDRVLRAVRSHAAGRAQSDDITLLCASYCVQVAQMHGIDDVPALHEMRKENGASYRADLALEELAVNAFLYGGATFVSAEFKDGIYILTDDGAQFDPLAYEPAPPPPAEEPQEIRIGGKGIQLVKALCSEFLYSRTPDGYNLMRLRIDEAPGGIK